MSNMKKLCSSRLVIFRGNYICHFPNNSEIILFYKKFYSKEIMGFNWNQEEIQEIETLNERAVSEVLTKIENNATEEEISDYIIKHTGQPNDLVIQEVRRVLQKFVSYGFLVKIGNKYRLPSAKDIFQTDCDNPNDSNDTDDEASEEEGAVGGAAAIDEQG